MTSRVKPMIALSGVRSSWLMLARKTLLARLASSASSLAERAAPPRPARARPPARAGRRRGPSARAAARPARGPRREELQDGYDLAPDQHGKAEAGLDAGLGRCLRAREVAGSRPTSAIQTGLPLARTRPGSPVPEAKRIASVAARKGAKRSGSARCQRPSAPARRSRPRRGRRRAPRATRCGRRPAPGRAASPPRPWPPRWPRPPPPAAARRTPSARGARPRPACAR